MGWAEAITAGCAVVTAGTIVWGVSAWRREYVGKRKIELAETVLALFYEAEDAIREIRSSTSFEHEGKTRKRGANESERQSKLLDRVHVTIERLETKTKLFSELRTLRYRAMVTFGPTAGEAFEEIRAVTVRIFVSACELGSLYEEDRELDTEEKDLRKRFKAILWRSPVGEDSIDLEVRRAVEKIEALTKAAVNP